MDDNRKPRLFEDFPPVTTSDWEAKIHEDLKGADYEKRLVWKTTEGIPVNPYYRAEHLEGIPHIGSMPGETPFVRGVKIRNNDWQIRQDFDGADPGKASTLAAEALAKGAEAIGLNVEGITSKNELDALLNNLELDKFALHLQHGSNYPELFQHLIEIAGLKQLEGSLGFDPLAYFLLYEKFHKSREISFERAADLLKMAIEHQPRFRVISINGQHYRNAGANIVQGLAFSMSQAVEYLASLSDMGFKAEDIAPHMQFNFAIGSSYFMEMAGLRAARMLWTKIMEAYGMSSDPKMFVHAVTSNWNKSIYDPYVNMLRTTTEAMAAALGGANSICINAFDNTFRKADGFSYRMARNQQIILKHEAHFNKVADPAAGSYYIEKLSDDIFKAAWELFVKTEDEGGFIKAVESGSIRTAIEETCRKRDMDIAMRKRVFVGTNQYANTAERMLDRVEPTAKLTDVSVLRQYRGPQAFEALRMAVENHVQKGFDTPKVFLFTYGNLTMRKARATFAGNFFGVAGYKIIDNLGFPDIGAGVNAALDSKAHIVVLCSSDEEYMELAAAAGQIKAAAPETKVVVAGNPKDIIEQLNDAGVDHYIHMRTNVLDSLTHFNDMLGIA